MTKTTFEKDVANKSMHIERTFDAPLHAVWNAWTDSTLLDLWWAPKPYRAVTKEMNFANQGQWLYYMLGPEGDKTYCKASYSNISPLKSYEAVDAFCDENGVATDAFPNMHWKVSFHDQGEKTLVTIDIRYDSVESMEKIIEMGFQEGFSMAHDNLDEMLLKGE
jgi:uncharacterized protein YndB with AHSA1/START domain